MMKTTESGHLFYPAYLSVCLIYMCCLYITYPSLWITFFLSLCICSVDPLSCSCRCLDHSAAVPSAVFWVKEKTRPTRSFWSAMRRLALMFILFLKSHTWSLPRYPTGRSSLFSWECGESTHGLGSTSRYLAFWTLFCSNSLNHLTLPPSPRSLCFRLHLFVCS